MRHDHSSGWLTDRQARQGASKRINLISRAVGPVPAGDKAPPLQFLQLPLQSWSRDARGGLDFTEGIRSFAYRAKRFHSARMRESSGRFEEALDAISANEDPT